jgi:CRP/FNR family transcriptional regulator, anaerobic regulatory protein
MTAPRARDPIARTFPFLASLPARARDQILASSVRKKLENKQVLVPQQGDCAWLPFVLQGTLRIYKTSPAGRELTLYRIERGESCILSATCILNGGTFPAVAEAEGPTEVLLTPARLLAELVEDNAAWRQYMFELYSRRLAEVLAVVEEVAFHHVDMRIAAHLLRHASSRGGVVTRTHGELADEIGTSREVVTRILKDLEVEGLIATARGRIRVLDAAGLGRRTSIAGDV